MTITLTKQETVDLLAWAVKERKLAPQGYTPTSVRGLGRTTVELKRATK